MNRAVTIASGLIAVAMVAAIVFEFSGERADEGGEMSARPARRRRPPTRSGNGVLRAARRERVRPVLRQVQPRRRRCQALTRRRLWRIFSRWGWRRLARLRLISRFAERRRRIRFAATGAASRERRRSGKTRYASGSDWTKMTQSRTRSLRRRCSARAWTS